MADLQATPLELSGVANDIALPLTADETTRETTPDTGLMTLHRLNPISVAAV